MDDIVGKRVAEDTASDVLEAGTYMMRFDDIKPFGKGMQRNPETLQLENVLGEEFQFTIDAGPPQGKHALSPVGRSWKRAIYRTKVDAEGNDLPGKEKANEYSRKDMSKMVKGLGAEYSESEDGTQRISFANCQGRFYSLEITKGVDRQGNDVNYINKIKAIPNYGGKVKEDTPF